MKLQRDEFFGNDKILKLTTQINKRTINGFHYLNIRDPYLIILLKENIDWLDYVGITIQTKEKNLITIRWGVQ